MFGYVGVDEGVLSVSTIERDATQSTVTVDPRSICVAVDATYFEVFEMGGHPFLLALRWARVVRLPLGASTVRVFPS